MVVASISVAERTDPGRDPNKQVNEDSSGYLLTRLGHLLVVCDGMGGHALGREASQLAVSTIVQFVEGAAPGTPPGYVLASAIAQAGRLVYQMGGSAPNPSRPGSTCVAVLVHDQGAEIAHVGDSRVYVVRLGQIWQLTKDHSVVQQMLDRGEITAEQAAGHPDANVITRALGMKPDTEVELREPAFACAQGDVFVLASDGLTDLVRADEIAGIVTHAASLDAACQELIGLANARGGHDNITVQIAVVQAPSKPEVALAGGGIAPTLVEAPAPTGPEKTLIDPESAALAPTPLAPNVGPIPLAAARVAISPGPPARGGCLVLIIAAVAGVVILIAVAAWWFLRSR